MKRLKTVLKMEEQLDDGNETSSVLWEYASAKPMTAETEANARTQKGCIVTEDDDFLILTFDDGL